MYQNLQKKKIYIFKGKYMLMLLLCAFVTFYTLPGINRLSFFSGNSLKNIVRVKITLV